MSGAHPAGGSLDASGGQGAPRYRDVPMGGSLAARFETRADGSQVVTSTEPLQPYATRLTDRLLHWAEATPDQTLVAKRVDGGDWRRVSDAEALASARSIAQALLDHGLSVERPLAILSDNDIEHLLLGLGAMLAGVPFAPISAAYSLLSQDHSKLRHIVGVLTPGMVFAADGAAFAKAIPLALKKAKPGTREFRAALKEALETMGRTPVSQGVLNFTATDHFGYQPETGVLLTIAGGDWKLAPTK